MLDDTSHTPAHWRVCWALVGLPTPLLDGEWPAMLDGVERTYGPETVVAALREAARFPTTTGWTRAGRDRAAALADAWQREVAA